MVENEKSLCVCGLHAKKQIRALTASRGCGRLRVRSIRRVSRTSVTRRFFRRTEESVTSLESMLTTKLPFFPRRPKRRRTMRTESTLAVAVRRGIIGRVRGIFRDVLIAAFSIILRISI